MGACMCTLLTLNLNHVPTWSLQVSEVLLVKASECLGETTKEQSSLVMRCVSCVL